MTDQDYDSNIIAQMRDTYAMNLDSGRLSLIHFPIELIEYSVSRIGEDSTSQVLDYISEHMPGASGEEIDFEFSQRLSGLFGTTLGTIEILAEDSRFSLPEEVFDEFTLGEIRGYSLDSECDETGFDSVYDFLAEEDEKKSLKEKRKTKDFLATASVHGLDAAIVQSRMNQF